MAGLRPPQKDIGAPGGPRRARIAVLVGVFVLLTLALALLDRVGLEPGRTPQAIAGAALVLFALVAIVAHGRRPVDHYVAAHEVSSRLGGMATAGAIAGLVILGVGGSETAAGAEITTLVLGFFVGLAVLSFAVGPRLRAFGGYGAGDLLAARFGAAARLLGAVAAFCASALIYVAFLKAAQPIVGILFGFEAEYGLYALAGLTAFLLLPGGQRSLVWSQGIQTILLATACVAAIAVLLMPGATPDDPTAAGAWEVLGSALLIPNESGFGGLVVPVLLVGAGTASLPFLLGRALSTNSPEVAQSSLGWASLVSLFLIAVGIALNAFLDNEAGVQIVGLLSGDLFQQATLLATVPAVVSGLLLAGALAVLLATGQAALLAAAGAISHDIWDEVIDRRGPEGRRIVVARLVAVGLALGGAWLALRTTAEPSWLLSWALAVAGAGLFAPLVLALFWRSATPVGIVLGMAAGLAVAGGLLFLNVSGTQALARIEGDPAIGPLAATALGIAASFLVAMSVSGLRTGARGSGTERGAVGRRAGRRGPIWERPA